MADEQNKKRDPLTWKDFLPIILAVPLAILVKIFILLSYNSVNPDPDHLT